MFALEVRVLRANTPNLLLPNCQWPSDRTTHLAKQASGGVLVLGWYAEGMTGY